LAFDFPDFGELFPTRPVDVSELLWEEVAIARYLRGHSKLLEIWRDAGKIKDLLLK
jgi:hypothetical protein